MDKVHKLHICGKLVAARKIHILGRILGGLHRDLAIGLQLATMTGEGDSLHPLGVSWSVTCLSQGAGSSSRGVMGSRFSS